MGLSPPTLPARYLWSLITLSLPPLSTAMLFDVIVEIVAGGDKQQTHQFCSLEGFVKPARCRNSIESGDHLPIRAERRQILLPKDLLLKACG